MNYLIVFVFSLISTSIAIFNVLLKPIQKKFEEVFKENKKVKELFDSIQEFINYLQNSQYWDNNETKDEKINTKILSFNDNIEDLRKYFGFNIINEERGEYNKKITVLEGRYIITFRNHIPFESFIDKKGRVRGPFKLIKENNIALEIKELMFNEIKLNLKNKYNFKI